MDDAQRLAALCQRVWEAQGYDTNAVEVGNRHVLLAGHNSVERLVFPVLESDGSDALETFRNAFQKSNATEATVVSAGEMPAAFESLSADAVTHIDGRAIASPAAEHDIDVDWLPAPSGESRPVPGADDRTTGVSRRAILTGAGIASVGAAGALAWQQGEDLLSLPGTETNGTDSETPATPPPEPTPTRTDEGQADDEQPDEADEPSVDPYRPEWFTYRANYRNTGRWDGIDNPDTKPNQFWTNRQVTADSAAVIDRTAYSMGGNLTALDIGDEELQWQVETDATGGGIDSEPAPTVVDGTVYLGATQLYALDSETGELKWEYAVDNDAFVYGAPVVTEDRLFIGAGGIEYDEVVVCLDRETGTKIWERPVGKVKGSLAYADGTLYATHSHTSGWMVRAMDAEDGSTVWKTAFGSNPDGEPTVVYGDHVYVTHRENSERGTLHALNRSDGTEAWTADIPANVPLAVADGAVLVVSDVTDPEYDVAGRLVAIDAETGRQRWVNDDARSLTTPPNVVGDHIYIGATTDRESGVGNKIGYLRCLDTEGRKLWDASLGTAAEVRAIIPQQGAVVAGEGRKFAGFSWGEYVEPETEDWPTECSRSVDPNPGLGWRWYQGKSTAGTQDWQSVPEDPSLAWTASNAYRGPVLLTDGVVFCGPDRQTVVARDAVDGTEQWRLSLDTEGNLLYAGYETLILLEGDRLVGVDVANGRRLWDAPRAEDTRSTYRTVADGSLYRFDRDDDALTKIDIACGTRQWETSEEEIGGDLYAWNGKVYVINGVTEDMWVVDADDGTVTGPNIVPGDPVAAIGDILFCLTVNESTASRLSGFDLRNHETVWGVDMPERSDPSEADKPSLRNWAQAVDEDTLYLRGATAVRNDGTILWGDRSVGSAWVWPYSPAGADGTVVLPGDEFGADSRFDEETFLVAVDVGTGEQKWELTEPPVKKGDAFGDANNQLLVGDSALYFSAAYGIETLHVYR